MRYLILSCLMAAVLMVPFVCGAGKSPGGEQAVGGESPPGRPRNGSSEEGIAEQLRRLGAKVTLDARGNIQAIEAIGTGVTDAELARIGKLSALESLEIGGGKISDRGLAVLSGIPTLLRLYLHDLPLTDASLVHVAKLADLEALGIQGTRLEGPGLVHLSGLQGLQVLNLSRSGVTDRDLAHIENLKQLETLSLERTRVTGAGLAHLKKMSRLRVLNLKGCQVAGDDLSHLAGIRSLKILYLKDTLVSPTEAEQFEQEMDSLAVFFY